MQMIHELATKRHKMHKQSGAAFFVLFVSFVARYGEQMRQGLKPCWIASDDVANPTRFLLEMRFTQ